MNLIDSIAKGHLKMGWPLCRLFTFRTGSYSISSIALFKLSHRVLAMTSAPAGEA